MSSFNRRDTALPDVTTEQSIAQVPAIDSVGMQGIAIPLHVLGKRGERLSSQAKVDVTVSLDHPNAKGIHMSRLYNLLQQYLSNKDLHKSALTTLMNALIESQDGLSNSAQLNLRFDLTVSRPALISKTSGYQSYPTSLCVRRSPERYEAQLKLRVPYSSTCPCSASLSRKALAEAFATQFEARQSEGQQLSVEEISAWLASKDASIATAHAQRSFADITLDLANKDIPDFIGIIDLVENALGTPLQTAVKREDEQAFAKRNAENLMFVEDSVRRLHAALSKYYQATYFRVKVEHQESLHAHDAIAEISGPVYR
ncbi:GTP cyclohydrolase I FolE2 [Alteromonas sp. BL110]|uniref:GTP cyclohydrolase FolE2 n=1 Tax=Alteromonas sp. BL110 TaxID=1714845 RepID=UPI000E4D359D|nr:GTP cyclohydrolase FolE2 [Alteromonas sp. BL110]AXT38778.1 GTP cyclohydrolase I FolE2 [Alteromonas sp. BL110]RKM83072.1 GTP cyclohydrolase I FolE2 [Alteromonas sp. BL110]